MGPVEAASDIELMDYFLTMVANHPHPKLIPTVTNEGEELDEFSIAWDCTIAEEQGFYPLVSSPSKHIPYVIMISKSSNLIGYLPSRPVRPV